MIARVLQASEVMRGDYVSYLNPQSNPNGVPKKVEEVVQPDGYAGVGLWFRPQEGSDPARWCAPHASINPGERVVVYR